MTAVAEWENLNLHKNRLMLTSSKTCSFVSSLVYKVWLISLLLNKQATWNYTKLLKSVWSFLLTPFHFFVLNLLKFALLILLFFRLNQVPRVSSGKRNNGRRKFQSFETSRSPLPPPSSFIVGLDLHESLGIWCSIEKEKFTLHWIFNVPNRYWC